MISTLIAYASTNAEVKERFQFSLFFKVVNSSDAYQLLSRENKIRKIKSLAEVL